MQHSIFTWYTEADPTRGRYYGSCGSGGLYQANVQMTHNPTFRLFDVSEADHKRTDRLAEKFNERFSAAASKALKEERKWLVKENARRAERGERPLADPDRLEVTVALHNQGFRLVFSEAPTRAGTRRPGVDIYKPGKGPQKKGKPTARKATRTAAKGGRSAKAAKGGKTPRNASQGTRARNRKASKRSAPKRRA